MKKAFSTKLLSLFVLVLTVAALVVVSSAANVWEAADGTGVVTTGDIAGAELAVVTTADNGDGTYTVIAAPTLEVNGTTLVRVTVTLKSQPIEEIIYKFTLTATTTAIGLAA